MTLPPLSEIRIFFSIRAQSLNHSKIKVRCYFCILLFMVKVCDHLLGETAHYMDWITDMWGQQTTWEKWLRKYFTLENGSLKMCGQFSSPSQKTLHLQPTGHISIMGLLSQTSSVCSFLASCMYCSSFFKLPFMT